MAENVELMRMLVDLKNRIVKDPFGQSEWTELGALTGRLDEVESHPRLLRSLSFADDDYDGHVLTMLRDMVKANFDNLATISTYVDSKCPDEEGENVSSQKGNGRRIVFTPNAFSVPEGGMDRRLVSVMMPFSPQFSAVYDSIVAAAQEAEMRCDRADNIWEHSVVIQDIFTLIFRSFVVCDFSSKNPNVFYEAGIAHTLGKHVIPITQSADDVPFDLKHHRYLSYLNNKEGRKLLQTEVAKRLKTLVGSDIDW